MSPDRRTVVKGLGAGGLVVAAGLVGRRLVGGGDDAEAPATTPPPPEPASSMAEALAAVGTRYLEEHPDEADRTLLLGHLPALDGQVPSRPGQALAVLADQVRRDAAAGAVLALDGWVLTRTECRAAALYAV